MTRLTQEQIEDTWAALMEPRFAPWHIYGPTTHEAILGFARSIAALAVQEVERERVGVNWEANFLSERHFRKDAEAKVATLTAQLAERDASSKANEGSLIRAIEHERSRAERAEAQLAEAQESLLAAHKQLRSFGVEPKPPLGFAPNGHAGSRSWFEAALAEVTKERDIWHDNAMHEKRHAERARAQLAGEVEKRKAARADADDASEAAWANRKLVEMLEAQLATAKREEQERIIAEVKDLRSIYTNNLASDYAVGWHEACDAMLRKFPPATPSGEGYHHFKCGADTHGAFCDERCCQRNTEAVLRPATPSGKPKLTPGANGEADHCSLCGFIPRTQSFNEHCRLSHPATPSPEAREEDSEFLLRVVQEVNAYAVITPADAKRIVAMARTGGTE